MATQNVNESKYIRELKKQITKLKKEIAALKKKNRVMANEYEEYVDLLEEIEDEKFGFQNLNVIVNNITNPEHNCPQCQAVVVPFDVHNYKFFKCEGCGAKGRLKS